MSAPLASDFACAERVALALAPLPGLAAVLLGGVGDDWLRAPVYPYAVVRPESAEQPRGGVTRTIRVRLAVRGADAGSKPTPEVVGYTDWTFAAGLLEAARDHFGSFLQAPTRLGFSSSYDLVLFGADGAGIAFARCALRADSLAAVLVDAIETWVLNIVAEGGTVATRAARTLLRVGAGAALDTLMQTVRDTLAAAPLGAPLENIATEYDEGELYPAQTATLSITLADAQAFGDSF